MYKIGDTLKCVKEHRFQRIHKDATIQEYELSLNRTYTITDIKSDYIVIDKTSKVYFDEISLYFKHYFKSNNLTKTMATQVIVLGQTTAQPKPIYFIRALTFEESWKQAEVEPNQYEFIELIDKNYSANGADIMFAYNGDRNNGVLYLGYFNDGIV